LDYSSAAFHSSGFLAQLSPVSQENTKPVIVIRHHDDLLGFEVDQLIGEQELVIRPLGDMIRSPSYIHGASVLAAGQLTLVIDGAVLLRRAFTHQQNHIVDQTWAPPGSQMLPFSSGHRSLSLSPTANPAGSAQPLLPFQTKSNARILVVEDSITTRQALILALQKARYQVFQAKDEQAGIEQLQHQVGIQ
jgi:chemotaxis protein histidine kinase CheA